MPMKRTPRYTAKKYIILIVLSATIGLICSALLLSLIGFGSQGILAVILLGFPVLLFACLRGFLKGLIAHYGFKEKIPD
jgi:hypothetical protein